MTGKKRLGVLFSSGKDSVYAMHKQHEAGFEIACLISVISENKDSYMFHTPAVELAKYQAEALGIPLLTYKTKGEKEIELDDLKHALSDAKKKHKLDGIITGALYSTYQKSRIDKLCAELGLEGYSPLWHMDQERELRELIAKGFKFIMTKVAAEGFDEKWLGREITGKDVDKLVALNKKYGSNIAGEGGEFESFVLDAPMFRKKLEIVSAKKLKTGEHTAELLIEKVRLADK